MPETDEVTDGEIVEPVIPTWREIWFFVVGVLDAVLSKIFGWDGDK